MDISENYNKNYHVQRGREKESRTKSNSDYRRVESAAAVAVWPEQTRPFRQLSPVIGRAVMRPPPVANVHEWCTPVDFLSGTHLGDSLNFKERQIRFHRRSHLSVWWTLPAHNLQYDRRPLYNGSRMIFHSTRKPDRIAPDAPEVCQRWISAESSRLLRIRIEC